MENKFSRIAKFVDTLERNELTDEQQAMLLIGTSMSTGGADNCKCNNGMDNCKCNGGMDNCNC